MHSAFDELWCELEPEQDFTSPLKPPVERISNVKVFRYPGYIPPGFDGRTEFADYSKRLDDYMGENGKGCVDKYSLGKLCRWGLDSLRRISPDFIWTEVSRNRWEMLTWQGQRKDQIRIGTLDLWSPWVDVNIFDETETWKVSHVIIDSYRTYYDVLTFSIKEGGFFALRHPDGCLFPLPIDLNDGPSLDRHYSSISLDLRDWSDAI